MNDDHGAEIPLQFEPNGVVDRPAGALRIPVQRSQAAQLLHRFRRNTSGMVGLVLVLIIVVPAVVAPLLTTADPADMDTSQILKPPNTEHPFGTDDLGRDVFSRVLYGARISILVGLTVAFATSLLGMVIGVLSGFYPSLDNPLMRSMDILMAFPGILLALAIVAILGPQLMNIIIALIIVYTPRSARVVRGMALQLKHTDFIIAARSVGASDLRILWRHILPNSLAPLIVQQTYILGLAVLAEAGLTFLGVGVPPRTPTLGGIISDARTHLRYAAWLSLFPGLAISCLVLGTNLLGDGLRDVLDPHMKL